MAELESWIGREFVTTTLLDAGQANRLAVTLDREPSFTAGDQLPPAWHWLFFHDLIRTSDLGTDGHPKLGLTMPPTGLPRRMWAGGELEFLAPLILNTEATRTSVITAITPKEGSTGKLCFVTVESTITVDGNPRLRERQDIVYREPVSTPPGSTPEAPAESDFSLTWQLDPTTLFRYSALTFNSHRIHYDADYARDIEGYNNLVIHGPLIATLLLDLAERNGHTPHRLSYRAKSALTLPEAFTAHGSIDQDVGKLWAASPSGRLAMEARFSTRSQ